MGRVPQYSIAQRAQALQMYADGKTRTEIQAVVGYSPDGFNSLLRTARSRGYVKGGPIYDHHVQDSPRSGRPAVRRERERLRKEQEANGTTTTTATTTTGAGGAEAETQAIGNEAVQVGSGANVNASR
ncbi:hypothetical protein BJ166DRAFT_79302 [Pestalotiopsis sp. NC0098]|nr:hypothetical protein BJ166DRAFT_79302 [Pestalotiopsis sp. NC0098]